MNLKIFTAFLLSFAVQAAVAVKAPTCQEVLVLSGGGSPTSNHERYYESISRVHEVFNQCPIANYVTTGNPNDLVLMSVEQVSVPAPTTLQPKKTIKIKKLKIDAQSGLPMMEAQIPQGGFAGAASYEDLISAAENTAKNTTRSPGRPTIFYVTDHGQEGGDIVLWNNKTLNTTQMHEVLQKFPQDKKVILLFDQCYGGDMLKSLWNPTTLETRPRTCGIAAASPGQMAFSTGGVMKKIHEIFKEKNIPKNIKLSKLTYKDIYHLLMSEGTIRSTPILSSDLYANEWFNKKRETAEVLTLPAQHCFNKNFPSPPQMSKENWKKLFEPLKKQWEILRDQARENKDLPVSIEDLFKQFHDQEEKAQKLYEKYNHFLAARFNRHIREKAEKAYKEFNLYEELKNKKNKGESMTEEEEAKLIKMHHEIDLLKTVVKDEAKIAGNHPQANLLTAPESKTIELIKLNDTKKKARNDALNTMFRTKDKITKITTLNALNRMMEEGDFTAAQNYLQLLDCENTLVVE